MTAKKKILFIQHASNFGGSAMSLLYTIQGLKTFAGDKYKIMVALAKWTKPLADFYEQEDIDVIKTEWIDTYEHTQLVHYNLLNPVGVFNELKQQFKINKAKLNTERLIEISQPDIVHLNSVVLIGSAFAAHNKKTPLVWHVREPSVKGLFGVRRLLIKRLLRKLADKIIFICEADKASWGNPLNGTVIYNFIDFKKFNFKLERPSEIDGTKIPQGDLNILFLGALGRIKGGLYLVKAVNVIINKYPSKNIIVLFPGSIHSTPTYLLYKIARLLLPLIGLGTYSQLIINEINRSSSPNNYIKLSYIKDVPQLFAASDVLVFPSIRPHFARPIIEAGAMAKPAIGSKLGGVIELIENSTNGFLVKPKSVNDLVEKISYFIETQNEIKRMGMNNYAVALKKFQNKPNISLIIKIYDELIPYSQCT